MEAFQEARQIQKYKRRIGLQYANYNPNGKIWVPMSDHIHRGILFDSKQQITHYLSRIEKL